MSEEVIIVDKTRDIEKIGAEEACERIVAWLTKRGGKVDDKMSRKPNFIWAKHGSYTTVSGWAKNAKKVMQFYLTPIESGVHVRVTIEPTSMNKQDVIMWRAEAERNRTELADELWLEFGVYSESVLQEKFYGVAPRIRALEEEKLSAAKQFKWGTLIFIILVLALVVLVEWTPFLWDELTEFAVLGMVFLGVVPMMYGGIKLIQLRSKIKTLTEKMPEAPKAS